MKKLTIALSLAALLPTLAACEYKESVTNPNPQVVEHRTTVVQPAPTTTVVTPSVNCPNGYDASTNTCY